MTYAAKKLESGRRPITTAKLSLDRCVKAYGQTSTNLLSYSEQFDNVVWIKTRLTVTANQVSAPDGALTADKIIFTGVPDPYIEQSYNTGSALASRTFTFSVWLWTDINQPTAAKLYIYDNSVGDIGSKDITLTATPTLYTFSHTFGAAEADTIIVARFDGVHAAGANEYLYAWGAMLNESAARTHYVQTTAASASSSCTASAAAGMECFNTFATCQDTANYDSVIPLDITLTMAKADILEAPAVAPGGVYIPCINSIRIAPEKITPGKGLSHRGSVSIECIDFPHHDINIDPYVSTRSYTPVEQGSFFGKLVARNKHYIGRPLAVSQYFYGDGRYAENKRELLYIIDTIDGPDARGRVKITAKDPLVLTEASKAQCPVASTGTLAANLASGTTTTFALNTGEGADYPTTAHVLRINDELISITSRSGDTFTIAARGHGGTAADDHSQDDTVQLCYVADGTASARVDLVLADLLENYAAIPAAYIPTVDWDTEADTWANAYYLETIISEPTPVNTLLAEICVETNSDLWWSAHDQEIKWQTQTPDFDTLAVLTDADFIYDSAVIKSKQSERVSRVMYYSDVRNWTESLEAKNYKALQVRIDTAGETADAYNSPAIKKIFARWMQNVANTGEIASRYISRFKNPPLLLTGDVDLKDIDKTVGQHINIVSELTQNEKGAANSVEMQILSIAHSPGAERVRIEAMQYRYESSLFARVGPDTLKDYLSESAANKEAYAFICDTTTLQMSNGDDPYLII